MLQKLLISENEENHHFRSMVRIFFNVISQISFNLFKFYFLKTRALCTKHKLY